MKLRTSTVIISFTHVSYWSRSGAYQRNTRRKAGIHLRCDDSTFPCTMHTHFPTHTGFRLNWGPWSRHTATQPNAPPCHPVITSDNTNYYNTFLKDRLILHFVTFISAVFLQGGQGHEGGSVWNPCRLEVFREPDGLGQVLFLWRGKLWNRWMIFSPSW